MVSEKIYDLCKPILEDAALEEEEKTDKLEELLSSAPTSLKGKALEDAVLGSLWQWKSVTENTSSPPPARNATVIRSRSPAHWVQRAVTPTSGTGSPRPSSAAAVGGPGLLARTKSSTQSPFSSPRNSPRLAVATPAIPHSPRLSAYQFADSSPATENYGDYGSDTVDWLVNDDTSSNTSFGDVGFGSEFISPYTTEMSPYDMLRSILQDNRADEELETLLEANGYDLGQTVNSIMEVQELFLFRQRQTPRHISSARNHICKYWLQGNCIAGDRCLFSHDPTMMMQQLAIASSGNSTPQQFPPNFQLQDYDSFPALQPSTSNPYDQSIDVDSAGLAAALQQQALAAQVAPAHLFPSFVPTGPRHGSKPNSRPGSRHNSRAPTPNQPNFQDDEAFPTLGSAAATKPPKRHHGKRGGHGHHNNSAIPTQPSNLADVVRLSPSPGPNAREAMRRGLRNNRSFTSSRENSSAAMAIPSPTDIPWLETGEKANLAYLKARQEAFKHGGLRNKFLQSAAQAWNRNDARGAKALSLRGQNENSLMKEKHREAARVLYEERNKNQGSARELYIDLHGLHPEEAVPYLSSCLKEQQTASRPVYAICGTGHHSKNGKDKVGKAIRVFLNEWKYAFREFSVPGDRNNVGGILGIDPSSFDKTKVAAGNVGGDGDSGVGLGEDTKVTVLKEDPRKAAEAQEAS